MNKKAIVSVTNDLSHDQRVHKVCLFLSKNGYDVKLIGRRLNISAQLSRTYQTHRFRLFFNKNIWFYAEYNIRLFFYLLFHKSEILVSNDLDTLPANYIISKIKNVKLFYDSHEFFLGVPELNDNLFAKKVWQKIETFIFPKLNNVYTVNESIAALYKDLYGNHVEVVKNIPTAGSFPKIIKNRQDLGLPEDKKIIILQGAGINVDRGAEEAVEAMKYLNNIILLIAGSGDVLAQLKTKVKDEQLEDKVIFKDKMPYEELIQFTANSDLGLTLDKNNNMNYRYSLPNKIFDYLFAGIPVLASDLVELKNIIEAYKVGIIIHSHEPIILSKFIEEALRDENQKIWRENSKKVRNELNWENEEEVLKRIYKVS